MKIVPLNCPNCGKRLEIGENKSNWLAGLAGLNYMLTVVTAQSPLNLLNHWEQLAQEPRRLRRN